jgi:hypothetical protein
MTQGQVFGHQIFFGQVALDFFWNIPMVRVVGFLLFHYRSAGPGRMGSVVKRSAQERQLRQLLLF